MDLTRVNGGEAIAGLGGLLLATALFLPWFGGGGVTASAWESLRVVDLMLAATALLAIVLPLLKATQEKTDLPIAGSVLVATAGCVATILVLYRVLNPVGDASREIGLYIGLIAALAVAIGAWRGMADEET